jgi:16S rRNA processing protein RimM
VALVRVGKVVKAIGLKGHLGVSGTEGALASAPKLWLRRGSDDPGEQRRIVEARPQGRVWAVRIEGVDDRTAAERLVGREVWADREDLGEAGEDAHFWADLEGLRVETAEGVVVGTVTGLYETGGVDVLVVTQGEREWLVPLAPYVTVDRAAARVVVDAPEGLLDLDQPGGSGEKSEDDEKGGA